MPTALLLIKDKAHGDSDFQK